MVDVINKMRRVFATSSDKMARLAINSIGRATSTIHDPRNARYLRPLSIAADEEMANDMADVIYGAVAEQRAKDRTVSFDEVYRQEL